MVHVFLFLFLVAVIMACEEHCGREFSTLKFIPVYCESLARVPHVLCAAKLVASHEFQIFLSVLSRFLLTALLFIVIAAGA